jgi:hypothetical protein
VAFVVLPLALSRETLIESALVVLAVAALVVGSGAILLFRRERGRAKAEPATVRPDDPV